MVYGSARAGDVCGAGASGYVLDVSDGWAVSDEVVDSAYAGVAWVYGNGNASEVGAG